MGQIGLKINKERIQWASNVLKDFDPYDFIGKKPPPEVTFAYLTLEGWRFFQQGSIDLYKNDFKKIAIDIDNKATVAQRLKRIESIYGKIVRYPKIPLFKMQDIAGFRAVVDSINNVPKLAQELKNSLEFEFVKEYNYIWEKEHKLGYRGIHLVYNVPSKYESFDFFPIEIQIRSRIQHAWATAVETIGFIIGQQLKSGMGDEKWLNFFHQLGSVFAIMEETPAQSSFKNIKRKKLIESTKILAHDLKIESRLRTFDLGINYLTKIEIDGKENFFSYILEIDFEKKSLEVTGYNKEDINIAVTQYNEKEKLNRERNLKRNTVIVFSDTVNDLQNAYPNYFSDSREFIKYLNEVDSID